MPTANGDTARAMSQENVKVVRSFFEAFADQSLDAAGRLLDSDIAIRPAIVGGPEGVASRASDGEQAVLGRH